MGLRWRGQRLRRAAAELRASTGARGEPAFGNPYVGGSSLPPAGSIQAPSSWETFYTNEGTPYFVNSATGVTQWETPPGVRVDM